MGIPKSWESSGYPPGIPLMTRRVTLQPEDPYIVWAESTLNETPSLHQVLEDATFFAQRNVNESQHWILFGVISQAEQNVTQAYVSKYGMDSFQYAETYHTTYAEPVIAFGELYFAIYFDIDDAVGGFGGSMIIRCVQPEENDAYVQWNETPLGSDSTLKIALENAVGRLLLGVQEINYFFNWSIKDSIIEALYQAYQDKYGMDWWKYYKTYNSTLYDPVVAYDEYYFSFSWAYPDDSDIPSPWTTILIVAGLVAVGFTLMSITIVGFRRLRAELNQGTNDDEDSH